MIVGAFALAAYSWTVCLLLKRFMMPSWARDDGGLDRLVLGMNVGDTQ